MKKKCPENNYEQEQSVGRNLPEINSALDDFWNDPKKVMYLVDLLFLFDDPDRRQVCS
jgi:hypothetical protein